MKRITLFIAPLLLILWILELTSQTLYQSRSDMYFPQETFKNETKKWQILILGSSHAAEGINPEYFSKPAFNLAFSYQDLYYDTKLLEKYIESLPSLETIIQEISFFSLGYDTAKLSPHLLHEYYKLHEIVPRLTNIPVAVLFSSSIWLHKDTFFVDLLRKKLPSPYKIYPSVTIPALRLKNDTLLQSGYRYSGSSMKKEKLLDNAKLRASLYQGTYQNDEEFKNREYLKTLVELSAEHKKKVILITAPVTKEYKEQFNYDFLSRFYREIDNFLKEHPSVVYQDLSSSDVFESSDFTNSDHLNNEGSKKLTLIVNKSLNNETAF